MKTLKSAILASVATVAIASAAAPAFAEEEGFLGGEVSANVAITTQYRFRGVSLSNEDIAIQGGLDYSHESGFYVGTWMSSMDDTVAFGETEMDVYAGYGGEIEGFSYDIGLLMYVYPSGNSSDYLEAYGSVGADLGVASATVGMAYAFSSDNTGDQDNIYVYGDLESAIPDTPFTVSAHLGYEDGFFDSKLDWSIGASVAYGGLDFGLAYVDTDMAGDMTDATVVFSVGASF
ncbi:TorF family putative porin [Emcibacter sp.]|uniref:TorF family putative porin n=1 Tax=Emcibacter sp. TaxID=1979954 RepID=UPI002AA69F3C|nr:TorF family putative porin [Emcibacter sp.]